MSQANTMICSRQAFPTILSANALQQHQQQEPQMGALKQESASKKPSGRVTKIRRTRQSRNPQQSVARRNERERNRVKLINKGFDVLRDNLPVEYLQAVAPEKYGSGGDETPDLQPNVKKSSKAKKFSKVDTLRAAIQHIRMLEELIRSADPDFELAKIPGAISDECSMLGYDELDNGPLSIGQPASCASSSGASSSQNSHSGSIVHQHQSYQMYEHHQPTEQFVKLEPHIHQQIAPPGQPQTPALLETQSVQFQMMTQVHHDQDLQNQQQEQEQQVSIVTESSSEQTNLWIQQHQTTFGEQQQQQFPDQTQTQWYANTFMQQQQQQQQQQQHLVLEQQLSPVSLDSPAGQMQHQHQQHQQQQQQQQQQFWYAESSPSPQQSAQQQLQGAQMNQLAAFNTHQQHQIGLYSQ